MKNRKLVLQVLLSIALLIMALNLSCTLGAGGFHTVGIKEDGTVVAVGRNDYGQCNVGNWSNIIQVDAGYCHTVGLKDDGTVVAVGNHDNGACDVSGWTNITQVAAGEFHTVGLKDDGTVVAVGKNNYGQCNVDDWTNITQVAAGAWHTVGLKDDGTMVAVGWNIYGQCALGGQTDITQVDAGWDHTVGLKDDGTVVAVGNHDNGACDVDDWTDITKVDAGWHDTVGLKSDGTVVAVGWNDYGQCEVGDWTDIVEVAAGGHHTVGLRNDGTVVAVGDNSDGQCDVDDWILVVAKAQEVTDDTVDARAEADTEVVVTGTATVIVVQYRYNPGGAPPTGSSSLISLDKYFDVHIDDPDQVTEIEIKSYYTDAEVAAAGIREDTLRLFWLNDDDWVACSDSGVNTTSTNGYSGYMWAKIRATGTTPSLDDLQGRPFGGYGHPTEIDGLCFVATAAYGTDTAKELDILREFRDTILLPNSLGAKFVSLYYKISPPIADFISQHEVLRTAVRVGFVDPIVAILNWSHALWSTRGS